MFDVTVVRAHRPFAVGASITLHEFQSCPDILAFLLRRAGMTPLILTVSITLQTRARLVYPMQAAHSVFSLAKRVREALLYELQTNLSFTVAEHWMFCAKVSV